MFGAVWGTVLAVEGRADGIEELAVEVDGSTGMAINFPRLTCTTKKGDRVLLNTTAVDLGLGSGGRHFVAQVAGREERRRALGSLMKMRYTPWQMPVEAVEESLDPDHIDLGGMPVIVGELHSQLAPALLGARAAAGRPLRITYIMTDGGALPLALSRQVRILRDKGLIDGTITVGHAFGGDIEAVAPPGGLLAAKWRLRSDLAVVMMGPGIAGTGHPYGHSGLEQAGILDTVSALGGVSVAILRISFADSRVRHRGVSHHSRINLGRLIRSRVMVPVPRYEPPSDVDIMAHLRESGIVRRHDVRVVPVEPLSEALQGVDVPLSTMGRGYAEDPGFFLAAAAAGWMAARVAGGEERGITPPADE